MIEISKAIELIEQRIASLDFCTDELRGLYEPIEYTLKDRGKRLRPIMLLISSQLFSDSATMGVTPQAVNAAVAVEVFHNFTLLHDDLMDNAPTRRSRDTVHRKWGANRAILSGDAMVIMAYEILSSGSDARQLPELLRIFNKAAIEVCQGQQLDMEFESIDDISTERYIEMIRLKTSVLIAAAMEMGAVISGATQAEARLMYEFGLNIGLAFQIQDDYLDTYGSEETLGKRIGGDIYENKKTYLYITAISRANEAQLSELAQLKSCQDFDRKLHKTREIYNQLKIDTHSQRVIEGHYLKALAIIENSTLDRNMQKPLIDYVSGLLSRKY